MRVGPSACSCSCSMRETCMQLAWVDKSRLWEASPGCRMHSTRSFHFSLIIILFTFTFCLSINNTTTSHLTLQSSLNSASTPPQLRIHPIALPLGPTPHLPPPHRLARDRRDAWNGLVPRRSKRQRGAITVCYTSHSLILLSYIILMYRRARLGFWEPLPHIYSGLVVHPYTPAVQSPPTSPSDTVRSHRRTRDDVFTPARGNPHEVSLDVGDEFFAFEEYRGDEAEGTWFRG